MIIHDGIYQWEGWGGKLRLGSGKCRLRIFDLNKGGKSDVAHIKPIIVIVSDVSEGRMTVRSCAGHIATSVTRDFSIEKNRMLWVEYYSPKVYGESGKHVIPERFDVVEFVWHENRAIKPKWKPLTAPMLDVIKELVAQTPETLKEEPDR